MKSNRLSLNYSKSTYFIVTTKYKLNTVNQISIQIVPNKIISSNPTKYLGIFIDSDFKWDNHIKNILNKLAVSARILYTVWHYVSKPSLIKIYYSLVYPYL